MKMLLLVAMLIGAGASAWADNVVYKTLSFPDDNYSYNHNPIYGGVWTAIIDNFPWEIVGFNNNKWNDNWTYIKCGERGFDDHITITTFKSIDKAITAVSVTIDDINAWAVDNIDLYTNSVNDEHDFSTWYHVGSFTKAIGKQTVNLPTPTENLFYLIRFETNKNSNVNGFVTVSKVEYYYDSTDPRITVDPTTLQVEAEEKTGSFTVEYANFSGEITPNIVPCNADGSTPATYDWVSLGFDDNSTIQYQIEANNGSARTAYFKVKADVDQETIYSNLVTITQAKLPDVNPERYIYFGNASGSTKISSASVTGKDSGGNPWTITTEGTTSFTNQNDSYSQVGSKNSPATSITFTTTLPKTCVISEFSAKFGGFSDTAGNITLKVGDTKVGSGSLNATEDVVVSCERNALGNTLTVTVTNIAKGVKCYYITYKTMSEVTKEVTSYGWATYIPDYPVRFEEGDAWVVAAATIDDGITLAPVTSVPAQTPVLLRGEGTKTMTFIESADAPESNLLSVSDGNANGDLVPWVLAMNGDGACFKEWQGDMSALQGRVVLWLDFSNSDLPGSSRTLSLDGAGTQGISDIDHSTFNAQRYTDLQGRRVAQPNKGLYIVNGKIVIVK